MNRLQIANDYITVKYYLPATPEGRRRELERLAVRMPTLYKQIMEDHIRVFSGGTEGEADD